MKNNVLNNVRLVLIIIMLSIIPVSVLYYYFKSEANTIRKSKEKELSTIAEMKERQIKQWIFERKADTRLFKDSPLYRKGLKDMISNPNDIALRNKMLLRIGLTRKYYNYENIIVTDNNGNKIISVVPVKWKLLGAVINKIKEAITKNELEYTDFYFCSICKRIHLDFIAPVTDDNGNVFATTIIRVNPEDYLFPMLQHWPMQSKTSETQLVEREGDSVVLCNDLRFMKNSALNLKIPLKDSDRMAVKVIEGGRGIFQGKDYRGAEVLADLRQIEGTNWYMITKIDKAELLSEINFRRIVTIIFLVFILGLISAVSYIIYFKYRRKTYQKLYLKEKAMNKLEKEFKTTLYSIGDAVIITDNAGMVTNLNPMAEVMTGWKEEDAIGKPLEEVFKIINEESRETIANPVQRVLKEGIIEGLANHTILIAKDGREIPIADSGGSNKEC